ncbi:type VI secretion system ImpA family N-terminal domain-containing protein [Vibrio aerogenes]|nr:type VI secretion system ImpA family N-terminal domain-containing protein [Vibrio aerogenes]
MSQRIFIENKSFMITSEHDELAGHALYQSVKKEVYSERSPFSGGTNWEKVKQECEQLSQEVGADMAVSTYYTIALLKLDGLRGYALGLEFMYSCMLNIGEVVHETERQIQRLLRWANAQALIELQNLKAGYEMLRYLYQCEQYCQRISYLLQTDYPSVKADFESIGYVIFEHIDGLETCYQVALKRNEVSEAGQSVQVVKAGKRSAWPVLFAFIGGGILSGAGYWFWLNMQLFS